MYNIIITKWKERYGMIDYIPTEEELYRNNDIKINFEVPALLQKLIEQLDDLYEKKR